MTIDAQRFLDTATAFFLAGERCEPNFKFGVYGEHSLGAPTIVCYAFSVELALKLIHHLAAGKIPRVHSLRDLYNALPSESLTNLQYMNSVQDSTSGSRIIDEIDRYFEQWRYPFENDFLFGECDNPRRAFIECYREIRRIRPELKSVYEQNWGKFEPDWNWSWYEQQAKELREIDIQVVIDENRKPHEGINL